MNSAQLVTWAGSVPGVGSALRWFAHRYPEGSITQIRHGLATGLKWKRHHRYVNGYWLGHYELPIQAALSRHLNPGDTVFDVGANAGFFTLVMSWIVGSTGRCVALEPSAENCQSVTEQIELNQLNNCMIVQAALADRMGRTAFSFDKPGSSTGHLGDARSGERTVEVELTTLDRVSTRYGLPDLVKLDVEGAEVSVLRGATRVLQVARPTWLIELHDEKCRRDAGAILRRGGYRLFDLEDREIDGGETLPHHVIAIHESRAHRRKRQQSH